MVYRDFKDWNRRTIADKVLRYKSLNIDKNVKYGYQHRLHSVVYRFLDRQNSGGAFQNEIISNKVS